MSCAVKKDWKIKRGRWLARIGSVFLATALTLATAFALQADQKSVSSKEPEASQRERDEKELDKLSQQAGRLAEQSKFAEAIAIGNQGVALSSRLYGAASDNVAGWREWLAPLYERRDDWVGARKECQEVLAVRKKQYGDADWRTVDARLALSDLETRSRLTAKQREELLQAEQENTQLLAAREKGDLRKAIPHGERALEVRRRILGDLNVDTATSLNNLALLYASMADFAKAEPLDRQTLAIRKKLLGDSHPITAQSLSNLGLEYEETGNFSKAEPLLVQALEVRKRALGELHQDTALSLSNLAVLYEAKGDYKMAEPLYRQALDVYEKVLGKNNAGTATAMNNLGHFYYIKGEFAKAESSFRQSLEIRKSLLGENHPDTAASFNDLGLLYDTMGDRAKAEPLYRKALAINQVVYGKVHPAVALNLNNLAMLYKASGKYAQAEPLLKQAIEIDKKTVGESHANTALHMDNLASVCMALANYAKAESLYRQSLEIRKKTLGDQHPDTANCLRSLAWLYQVMGDYGKAEPLLKQALRINKKMLGPNHQNTAFALNNLALLFQSTADYEKAEPLFQEALAILRKVYGNQHTEVATCLGNLGLLYREMDDYRRAESALRESLEIRRKVLGDQHPDTAAALGGLGVLYRSMGDYSKAEVVDRQVVDIRRKVLGEIHPDTATALNNLAVIYKARRQYDKAEVYFRQAIDIYRKTLGEDRVDTARSLDGLAAVYDSTGKYDKAEPLYRQALAIRKRVLGDHHPDTATTLNNLAWMYRSKGDYAKAEPLARQALDINRKVLGEGHPRTADTLANLAFVYQAKGESAKAIPLMQQALMITERQFSKSVWIRSERRQLALAKTLRVALDHYLTSTPQSPGTDVYGHVLEWKGAVFMRQLTDRASRRRPDLQNQLREFDALSVRLSNLALRAPGEKGRAVWERQLADLSEKRDTLEAELAGKSAEFHQVETLLQSSPADLQRALPPRVALVDFLEYTHIAPAKGENGFERQQRMVAFVVRSDKPIARVELGLVGPLAEAAAAWRDAILHDGGAVEEGANSQGGTSHPAPQQRVKDLVWSPLRASLEGVDTVLESPDGVLNQLPLAALPGEKPGHYLLEEIKFATVPVPRLLEKLNSKAEKGEDQAPSNVAGGSADPGSAREQSMMIVGDVNYGGSPGKSTELQMAARTAVRGNRGGPLAFLQLEYTRSEMATIRDSFEKNFPEGRVKSLRGAQATESALRREASHYRWLHVATHGFFAPPEIASAFAPQKEDKEGRTGEFGREGISGYHPGLLSGLALSGANTPSGENDDDGILTAFEVGGLDLGQAQLVVLSACETGLGAVAGGEGVLGLQRAFQLAGAKSTIASLWKIPDRATMQLMQRLYENLWDKKMARIDALREAQLWMLKEGRQRGLDLEDKTSPKPASNRLPPRYWAAFVLSGNWR